MKTRSLVLITVAALSAFASAKMHPYEEALKFARSQVDKKPNDAQTRFALARVLSMGYADSPSEIDVTLDDVTGKVSFPDTTSVQVKHADGPLTETEKGYLKDAILNYNRATRFDSNSALYALGYAWMFEQLAWRYTEVLGSSSFGAFENESDVWSKVSAELRRATYLAKDKDLNNPGRTGADAYVSRAASASLLRLGKLGKARITAAEAKRLQKQIDKVDKIAG